MAQRCVAAAVPENALRTMYDGDETMNTMA
jgi:hypothetical protein